jgi:hypothetical protein
MLLGDSYAAVAEQNRNPFKWYASQQKFDRERVTKTVRVAVCELAASCFELLPRFIDRDFIHARKLFHLHALE